MRYLFNSALLEQGCIQNLQGSRAQGAGMETTALNALLFFKPFQTEENTTGTGSINLADGKLNNIFSTLYLIFMFSKSN